MQTASIPAMPLSMVRAGSDATVCKVRGDESMRRHLQEIGFVDGATVHVVSATGANLIVMVKGARFGVDAKVARNVMTV